MHLFYKCKLILFNKNNSSTFILCEITIARDIIEGLHWPMLKQENINVVWTSVLTFSSLPLIALHFLQIVFGILLDTVRRWSWELNCLLRIFQRLVDLATVEQSLRIVAIVAHDDVRALVDVDDSLNANLEIFECELESVAKDAGGAEVIENVHRVESRWPVDVKRQLKSRRSVNSTHRQTFNTSSMYSLASASRDSSW